MSIFDDVNKWEKTEGASIFSSTLNVNDPVVLDYVSGKAKVEKLDCIIPVDGREDYRHDFEDGFFDLVIYADMVLSIPGRILRESISRKCTVRITSKRVG